MSTLFSKQTKLSGSMHAPQGMATSQAKEGAANNNNNKYKKTMEKKKNGKNHNQASDDYTFVT